ncbi:MULTISPECIES: isoprenylcysteine carboxylmethyltransferase family protein [unclassified Moorena]|uniref:isoprenylcysteine carboxyl methyltransferase family protein n=1 Tax=unclassified Moorena TaxID=2683338 RepID=UPI0013C63D4C|nr:MULTISPECIES: isoprenylcysteine carboxylmethyltransferase family protein [unclassified Moorena]NEO18219.1 isoprenylcysteine carboxyl methyltransferase [Moorena sp. SIO4A5]NEP21086.1 isoprenylcysteine carboxyl methyltransferase [Moorena sp. SIO3I6]NEQ57309.1 isoprenylcysteine carboxyl methyltransferase [Moorena sp. SIO4A1]
MITKVLFTLIVVAVILQRLIELRISKQNATYLLTNGGREYGSNSLWIVKVLQVSWFAAMINEVWWFNRPFMPGLAAIALMLTVAGQGLRYLSMRSLKKRWTLAIITFPDNPVVNSGIYLYLKHPNWLGVILEIAALPLIHTAYFTTIVFSIANALLMSRRIHTEEQALSEDTNYADVFANRPRFIPVIGFIKGANSSR